MGFSELVNRSVKHVRTTMKRVKPSGDTALSCKGSKSNEERGFET
jgi:hypothetical protein